MESSLKPRPIIVKSAGLTALLLYGGLLLGFLSGFAVNGLPMHLPEGTRNLLSALPVLAIVITASAFWGWRLAQLTGVGCSGSMALAAALSFAPAMILAGIALSRLEVALVEKGQGPDLPIHNVFTLLFVPAVFCIVAIVGLALGAAHKDGRLAMQLGGWGGLGAALAFLVVDLVMDAAGYRVGALGAAERATMLTVMMSGNLAASLAGGAVFGALLSVHIADRKLPSQIF